MLNKVIIMGRLTADPELRQTPTGVSTCQITVAVNRNYVAQGQERQTDFITVVAWRSTAEFISRYFSKGKMIIVEGSLRTRTYDDKRYPDVRHYVTEVYADNVSFGETKTASQGQGQGGYAPAPQQFQQPQYNNNQQYNSNQQYNPAPQQAEAPAIAFGDLGDFEVIGDGDLPF
ncbi:MAG: single-stranded DNA-binding protein [Oscillospiraceae bacterium]|nr:single-stranded DNA-binding protein [Oscillospiraceae bacterium]